MHQMKVVCEDPKLQAFYDDLLVSVGDDELLAQIVKVYHDLAVDGEAYLDKTMDYGVC